MRALGPILAAVAALLVLLSSVMFTVDQRQNAIVFQLGEVKDVITKPGLNFKWPLIQNVRYFDMRILTFDDAEPLRFITSEKKPVLVDSSSSGESSTSNSTTSRCRATSCAPRRA